MWTQEKQDNLNCECKTLDDFRYTYGEDNEVYQSFLGSFPSLGKKDWDKAVNKIKYTKALNENWSNNRLVEHFYTCFIGSGYEIFQRVCWELSKYDIIK